MHDGIECAQVGPYSLTVAFTYDPEEGDEWRWIVRWSEDGSRYEDAGSTRTRETAMATALASVACEVAEMTGALPAESRLAQGEPVPDLDVITRSLVSRYAGNKHALEWMNAVREEVGLPEMDARWASPTALGCRKEAPSDARAELQRLDERHGRRRGLRRRAVPARRQQERTRTVPRTAARAQPARRQPSPHPASRDRRAVRCCMCQEEPVSGTNVITTDTDWREDVGCFWRRAGLLTLEVAPSFSDMPWRWSVNALGTVVESGRVATADEGKAKAERAAQTRGETIVRALPAESRLAQGEPADVVEQIAAWLDGYPFVVGVNDIGPMIPLGEAVRAGRWRKP